MTTEKVPFNLRSRRAARAEAAALMGQLEVLEAGLKSVGFKLNRRIKLLTTASEDYEFKIKMVGREKSSHVEYMVSRYRSEIEKNKQEIQKVEEVAAQVRVLLRENDILKKGLADPGADIENIKAEMERLKASLQNIEKTSPVQDG